MSRSRSGRRRGAWLASRWAAVGPVGRARWALGGLWVTWLLAVGLLAAELAARPAAAQDNPALRWGERWLYDLRLRALAPASADPQIVVIDIDERALAEHGRWPWRRALLADLLSRAAGPGGARLLGLDLVLAESDRSSGLAALEALVSQTRLDNAAGTPATPRGPPGPARPAGRHAAHPARPGLLAMTPPAPPRCAPTAACSKPWPRCARSSMTTAGWPQCCNACQWCWAFTCPTSRALPASAGCRHRCGPVRLRAAGRRPAALGRPRRQPAGAAGRRAPGRGPHERADRQRRRGAARAAAGGA